MVNFMASTYVLLSFHLLLGHCSSGSTNLTHNACKKAAKIDPNFSYHFCVAHLEQNPKSKHAKTLQELGVISIAIAKSKASHTRSHIKKLLRNNTRFDSFAEGCLRDCLDLYSDAIQALKVARSDFKSKDYDEADIQVSSAMEAPTTCEEGFGEKESEVHPLTKENKLFFKLAAISLAFTQIVND
ncbi:putative invertase inhibitor [Cornus florida]|uniref:putative invertase inhibitor n=1 Tax=Cornus florida TaxID=4283 RepID=UPI00289A4FFB|nr:putative invertase inhibitor [Cornus florida]